MLLFDIHSFQDLTSTNQSVPFLIIIAEARSGSTWLESFFKENENVLDFFEPLDARAFASVSFSDLFPVGSVVNWNLITRIWSIIFSWIFVISKVTNCSWSVLWLTSDQVVDANTLTEEEYTDIKLSILANECQCQFEEVPYPAMGERASWSKSLHVSNYCYHIVNTL